MTKLEWIGYDACLMEFPGSGFRAGSPRQLYDCLPGDQAGWGWNYDFLSELSDEVIPGDVMGEYIVDSYHGLRGIRLRHLSESVFRPDALPVDLNALCWKPRSSERFIFAELDTSLDVQNYPRLVRNRARVRDFGTYSSDI